jgi:hypothetical protein
MTWKDKAELGIKEDAAFRKDNLPPSQIRGEEIPAGPGRSPEIPAAREDEDVVPPPGPTLKREPADELKDGPGRPDAPKPNRPHRPVQ